MGLTGCELTDDQRCPDGYQYIPEHMVCCLEEDIWDPAAKVCKPKEEEGTSEDTGTGAEKTSGLGEPCQDDSQCTEYIEDFCAVNPLENAGYCTMKDCAPGDCADGYLCCDCMQSPFLPHEEACLNVKDAGQADSIGGCTCE